MKNLPPIFLLLLLLISTTSCNQVRNLSSIADQSPIVSEPETLPHTVIPSFDLVFRSEEEVDLFLNLTDSEAALSFYHENNWMIGDYNEAVYYAQIIRSVPWPLSGISMHSILVRSEAQEIVIGGVTDNNTVVQIVVKLPFGDAKAQLKVAQDRNSFQLYSETYPWSEESYYCGDNKNPELQMYYNIVKGYFLVVSIPSNNRPFADSVMQSLSFGTHQ